MSRGEEWYLVRCSSVRSRVRWEIIKDAGLWRWKPDIFRICCGDHPGDDRIRGRIEFEFEVIEVGRHSLEISASNWVFLRDAEGPVVSRPNKRCLMRYEPTKEGETPPLLLRRQKERCVVGVKYDILEDHDLAAWDSEQVASRKEERGQPFLGG